MAVPLFERVGSDERVGRLHVVDDAGEDSRRGGIGPALAALRSAVASVDALRDGVPEQLRLQGVPLAVCHDCGGFGLDVDEDGSITGTVGQPMVCGCVELGDEALTRAAELAHGPAPAEGVGGAADHNSWLSPDEADPCPPGLPGRLAAARHTADRLLPVLLALVAAYEEAEAAALAVIPSDTLLGGDLRWEGLLDAWGARELSRSLGRLDAVIGSFCGSDLG